MSDDITWTVHILGPDDILPAADYADAVRQANEINQNLRVPQSEFDPFTWASPVPEGTFAYWLTPKQLRAAWAEIA